MGTNFAFSDIIKGLKLKEVFGRIDTALTTIVAGALPGLASTKLWVGSSTGVATERTITGDVTIGNTGVTAITADSIINADIKSDAAIEFSKMEASNDITVDGNVGGLTLGVSSHNFAAGAVDWELSAAEQKTTVLSATNANGAVDAIAEATAGKLYIVINGTGQALTIKGDGSGATGVQIANTKTAIVVGNGTDFVRVTGDI